MPTLRELGWSDRLEAELPAAGASGLVPAPGQPRAHAYLSGPDRGGRVAGARLRPAAPPRRDHGRRSRRSATGSGSSRRRTTGSRGSATVLPRASRFSRRVRRRPHRGAGRRRQHRHRLPGHRARRRLQPAADRTLSPRRGGQRRHADHRAEQGGPRARSRACSSTRCAASRRTSRCTPCPATSPPRSSRCATALGIGRTGALLGSSGVGQEHHRQPARRSRPAGDPRRAHLGQQGASHQHQPADGACCRVTAS